MSDLIDRQTAINRIKKQIEVSGQDRPLMISKEMRDNWDENEKRLKAHYELVIEMLERLPAADPVKHGEWTDIQVFPVEDTSVEELQSARCSACGKIHTTPYMYYFNEYPYCPSCGAKMTEEAEE